MNCRDFEADLVDLARGAALDPGREAGLEQHLQGCPSCAARLADERQLSTILRAAAQAPIEEPRSDVMERRLLDAFAAAHPAEAPAGRHAHVSWWRPARPWLAAAALILLSVAVWRGLSLRPTADQALPAPGDTAAFVTLPTAIGLPPLESGRIVRVTLAVTSLPAYGIDVSPAPSQGYVEADVLVGQDEQPRAIRFVSLGSD